MRLNERMLPMPWGDMAYRMADRSGVPVIFLHGSGCDGADWDAALKRLPDALHPITLDFRGHGHSAVPTEDFTLENLADDVIALLAHLALPAPWLVGHSLGGMVAMSVARHGIPVSGLVLVEGWTSMAASYAAFPWERPRGTLAPVAMAGVRAKAAATRHRLGEAMWTHFWDTVLDFDATDFLASATVPILEIYGDDQRASDTERLLAVPANPAINWAWVPRGGHYLPQERPAEVAALCGTFITTTMHATPP